MAPARDAGTPHSPPQPAAQGPNYALAKRLQQWRAIWARSIGYRVSLNIAPSTTTASVVKNPALAAGFAGASAFGIEVFEPETTNALMAALWVFLLAGASDAVDGFLARRLDQRSELGEVGGGQAGEVGVESEETYSSYVSCSTETKVTLQIERSWVV